MAREKSKYSTRTRQIFYLVLAAAVFVAAALLLVFKDRIWSAPQGQEEAEAWVYDTGSGQVFAPVDNCLAVASSTGFQLLDSNGHVIAAQVVSVGTPALSAAGDRVAAWDIGGRIMRVWDTKGGYKELETEKDVISVTLSTSGHMALCSEEAGYKGLVTVYDRDLTPLYKWHSGAGYLISAAVSPDGTYLATLTVSDGGGSVHMFSLTSDAERGVFTREGELIVDICWLDGELCALGETGAVYLDDEAAVTGEYDYGGMFLTGKATGGDGFVTLALSRYLSGGTDVLVTLGQRGRELGRTAPDGEVRYLAAGGRTVAALGAGRLSVYTQGLVKKGGSSDIAGVTAVIVRQRGDVLLTGAYQAQPLNF